MFRRIKKKQKDIGLTLLEVLISLIITSIIVGTALLFFTSHYRLIQGIRIDCDLGYSLLRSGQVLSSVISSANEVTWTGKNLGVSYEYEGQLITDTYYLADKDYNGILDLYREHMNVPNPIAAGLTGFTCTELSKGVWQVKLRAADKGKEVCWERIIRQRTVQD